MVLEKQVFVQASEPSRGKKISIEVVLELHDDMMI